MQKLRDEGTLFSTTIDLSWIDRMAVDAFLDTLVAKIAFVSKEDQRVKLLMTIPGTDYFTALTIISEIVDIKRFSTPWKLVGM